LKAEAQRQQESASQEDEQPDTQSLSQLSSAISILETLGPSAGSVGAEARLAKQLSEASRPTNGNETTSEQAKRSTPSYTLSYQPSFDDQHALALAASFDTRLKELETALGLTSIPLPTQNDGAPKPLLPTLSTLEKQIELLSATTPAALDTMSKRIRHLTDEADRLNEKRKAAKQSYTEMRAAADATSTTRPKSNSSGAGGAMSSAPPSLLDDAEMEAKIGALYNTLPTIESLAPTLPAVLERLKSLRLLHADAADAATRVEQVEAQGREMSEEVALWRQGLEKMEKAVGEAEKTTKGNMATVEKWVQELEERVKGLKTEK
jgi:nuclear migration protein JNM1